MILLNDNINNIRIIVEGNHIVIIQKRTSGVDKVFVPIEDLYTFIDPLISVIVSLELDDDNK